MRIFLAKIVIGSVEEARILVSSGKEENVPLGGVVNQRVWTAEWVWAIWICSGGL